jgi:hypothetical protein
MMVLDITLAVASSSRPGRYLSLIPVHAPATQKSFPHTRMLASVCGINLLGCRFGLVKRCAVLLGASDKAFTYVLNKALMSFLYLAAQSNMTPAEVCARPTHHDILRIL